MPEPDLVLDALLWAWSNAMGRMPDSNTMSEDEIRDYWRDYGDRLRRAIVSKVGMEPDDYMGKRTVAAARR